MVTIKDVAEKARVAPSTVSRVIGDHKGISDETKNRVRKVMDELGYIPNLSARKLVTQQSNTIGLVLKTASIEMRQNPFFTDVLVSISNVCRKHQYSTMITTSMSDEELYEEVRMMVKSRAVDGIILLYSKINDKVMNFLEHENFPYVVIGRALDNRMKTMFVDNDNIDASYQLTEYLIELGHQKLAFVNEKGMYAVSEDRMTGFKLACKKYDIEYTVIQDIASREDALHAIDKLFESDLPGAIITSDSMMNLNILSALYEKGIKIPEHIQTATFNDSYINQSACPPQTVVNINPEYLGSVAADRLIELLKHPDMMKYNALIPVEIIERTSTKRL